MITVTKKAGVPEWQKRLLLWLHLSVLAGALGLVVFISYDTFQNISFIDNQRYLVTQFWICMLFLVDVVVEFIVSPRKWHYIASHIFFLLISIPYLNICRYYGIELSGELSYLIRFVPMLRAAYVLAVVTGALSSNRISSMFIAYIALLLTIVYFSSMMFYVEEHSVNPDCTSYAQALWWSVMSMTTAGCYVGEYTVTGKVLSVILSGGGLILFPVFTVYITHAVSGSPDNNAVDPQPTTTTNTTTTTTTIATNQEKLTPTT